MPTEQRRRQLARDIRDGREGVVMAEPDQWGARGNYWLRPIGGGTEWEVPKSHVRLLGDEDDE